jgi:hypothetical protein
LGYFFSAAEVRYTLILTKMGCATFWAFFSQTRLVTLAMTLQTNSTSCQRTVCVLAVHTSVRWTGVARWFISIPKIPGLIYFGVSLNGKCWYILLPFGIFYFPLAYFMADWYSLCSIVPVLVCMDPRKSGNPALD